MANPALLGRLADDTAQVYGQVVRNAAGLAERRGAEFYHFFQPNLFSKSRLTTYEANLERNPYLVFSGLRQTLEAGNATLRQTSADLAANDILAFNVQNALDQVPDGQEIFLDAYHVTELGKRMSGSPLKPAALRDH